MARPVIGVPAEPRHDPALARSRLGELRRESAVGEAVTALVGPSEQQGPSDAQSHPRAIDLAGQGKDHALVGMSGRQAPLDTNPPVRLARHEPRPRVVILDQTARLAVLDRSAGRGVDDAQEEPFAVLQLSVSSENSRARVG